MENLKGVVTNEIWMVVVDDEGIFGYMSRMHVLRTPSVTVYDGPFTLTEACNVVSWLDASKEVK